MKATVLSADGTTIAYENKGHGPPLVIVGGALSTRAEWSKPGLSELLAPELTIINFDRRGRGDSTDTLPYAPEREIEDIEALLNEFGGSGNIYGISSGAALALIAASRLGSKVEKLALYEPPYDSSDFGRKSMRQYRRHLTEFISTGRKSEAIALFMKFVGVPDDQANSMRNSPSWPGLEAIAPTLVYDATVMGDDRAVPTKTASKVTAHTLVMYGELSPSFMRESAQALMAAIPFSILRMVKGQTHDVNPEALAPILKQFFCAT